MTCLDCGKCQYVQRKELIRTARVRCLQCGGPTEISRAGQERTTRGQAAAHLQRERHEKR